MSHRLPQPEPAEMEIVTLLQALADPVRLELVRELSRNPDPRSCAKDCYDVEVSAPTLSHHWRVLREAGLTTTFVEGRTRWVELRTAEVHSRFPGLLTAVLS